MRNMLTILIFTCLTLFTLINAGNDSSDGERYFFSVYFKANYYKATEYCHSRGMQLVSIHTPDEQRNIERFIQKAGFGNERFWTSGSDLAERGEWFWMSSGKPMTYTYFNRGEPNNDKGRVAEDERCIEMWNLSGTALKWNDCLCSRKNYFICEKYDCNPNVGKIETCTNPNFT